VSMLVPPTSEHPHVADVAPLSLPVAVRTL
jgi:hypothetical protein